MTATPNNTHRWRPSLTIAALAAAGVAALTTSHPLIGLGLCAAAALVAICDATRADLRGAPAPTTRTDTAQETR